MKIAPLADVKARLSAYIDQAEKNGPVVITRNGKAAAVLLVPVNEDDLESIVLGRSPRLQEILERSRASMRAGDTLSEDEFWQEVERRYGSDDITERLNDVAATEDTSLDPVLAEIQARSLPRDEW
jgi:prevent-host-death family protein